MRAKQTMLHTMSRKGYACLEDEMIRKSETPEAITRGDVWIRGHTRKSGEFLNEEVATKKIQEANKNVIDVDKNSVKNYALAKALGPKRRGRVRGLGFGATPSQVSVQTYNRERVIMLEKELEDLKNIVHSLLVGRMGKNANSSPCVSTNHQGFGNLPNDSANHHANSANHHATSSKPQAKSSNLDASSGNLNHNSPKPQGTKCKLLNWTGTREVVALAEIASTNPQDLVHFVPLGPNHWKVWVLEILVDRYFYHLQK
ncbi:hypothetical protein D8674_024674 [Pyrus ussuriensis x Pyrus communis]|uniref:Uncharacterized protein n=1 Tax=Pyrus ussuriensis x Pyrus communis TaxID=2448454 RepID=A0A5N5H8P4_9ROSA|nr:hypothetical protein D8674_024674 [Pyrus ussuriensis x Pyrus communis]